MPAVGPRLNGIGGAAWSRSRDADRSPAVGCVLATMSSSASASCRLPRGGLLHEPHHRRLRHARLRRGHDGVRGHALTARGDRERAARQGHRARARREAPRRGAAGLARVATAPALPLQHAQRDLGADPRGPGARGEARRAACGPAALLARSGRAPHRAAAHPSGDRAGIPRHRAGPARRSLRYAIELRPSWGRARCRRWPCHTWCRTASSTSRRPDASRGDPRAW